MKRPRISRSCIERNPGPQKLVSTPKPDSATKPASGSAATAFESHPCAPLLVDTDKIEQLAFAEAISASLYGEVAVIDRNGRILAVNEAWTRFAREHGASLTRLGVGANYVDAGRTSAAAERDAQSALSGITAVLNGERQCFSLDYHHTDQNGDCWYEMVVHPLKRPEGGAIIYHVDVTSRRNAEREVQRLRCELAHVARVATLGELTASWAHELSQPLTAILSNAQAAQRMLADADPDLSELRAILCDIVDDDRRAAEIIRRLRALMRKGALEREPLDLCCVVREVANIVHNEARLRDVTVSLDFAPTGACVMADKIQLQQVVVNLMINALEAMKDVAGRHRSVTVRTRVHDKKLEVAVQDTGPGIGEDQLDVIFEPFITHKPNGMGMGLSVCRSIVRAHGGRIWAQRNDGHGLTVAFTLPMMDET